MKKILLFILSLTLIFSMSATSFARGNVTISNLSLKIPREYVKDYRGENSITYSKYGNSEKGGIWITVYEHDEVISSKVLQSYSKILMEGNEKIKVIRVKKIKGLKTIGFKAKNTEGNKTKYLSGRIFCKGKMLYFINIGSLKNDTEKTFKKLSKQLRLDNNKLS